MSTGSAQPVIGVLALQGDFAEHEVSLEACGVPVVQVRRLAQLEAVDGLVIPGGESTTMARLLLAFDLMQPLRRRIHDGMPVWGTCAGAILLANDVPGLDRSPIGVMDMSVERNAFGRQIDSFEADLAVTGLDGGPLHAVFIRAPIITAVRDGVEPIARLTDGRIVAARQGHLLATCFHPELTNDHRIHQWFVDCVRSTAAERSRA
jgi:5'-phosphate synthase pdxT subunit